MRITYLGHAGFCVETEQSIVVADPWLSSQGAFDGAWFQFPRNHHMAGWLQQKLSGSPKRRFIYISHEHKDHFDLAFLKSLACRNFTLVIPKFRRAALRQALADYACEGMRVLQHEEAFPLPDGEVRLFVDDSELNRDSALLIRADGQAFLNLNDCKLYDSMTHIREAYGPIDVFACQFSGATWHPTCYDYTREEYERVSALKRKAKFETVARAIDSLRPRHYLPSAGPACFLDPHLMQLNFERDNIFPFAPRFLEFLGQRLPNSGTSWRNWMPGDSLDLGVPGSFTEAPLRVGAHNFVPYIHRYASDYAGYFAHLHRTFTAREIRAYQRRLRDCLHEKLRRLSLRQRVPVPLYFGFMDAPLPMLRVDFGRDRVDAVNSMSEENFHSIVAPAWQVARVLDGMITWEDFALTFRMRLNRSPDLYQALIQGFLIMEAEDLEWFCAKVLGLERLRSRTIVEANGSRYRIDRFCPHQGGDLAAGWADGACWTCPRHRWQFNLEKEGKCTTSDCSINAVCLEPE
ncbi:MAG: Rieske 2Fe-2S domain-containing protein [Candidatus Acidiferrales bacterium]